MSLLLVVTLFWGFSMSRMLWFSSLHKKHHSKGNSIWKQWMKPLGALPILFTNIIFYLFNSFFFRLMVFSHSEIKQALSTTPRRRLVSQRGNYLDSLCIRRSGSDSTYQLKKKYVFVTKHTFSLSLLLRCWRTFPLNLAATRYIVAVVRLMT